jgi:cell division transport system permease protein
MPWIIAIIMFLTLLAAGAALSLGQALSEMRDQLAGGYTVQIVEANAAKRERQTRAVTALLQRQPQVERARAVPESRLREQIAPWIGEDSNEDLPIPALIDVEMKRGDGAITGMTSAIRRIAPTARIDAHAAYLKPITDLMRTLMWLATGLVALMIVITAAVVMLAAKSAHETQRPTIDIMHLLGATDRQIARLFQRRMAIDAIFGSVIGLTAAALVMWLLGERAASMESQLMATTLLTPGLAATLLLIPIFGVTLSVVTAHVTVKRALERSL